MGSLKSSTRDHVDECKSSPTQSFYGNMKMSNTGTIVLKDEHILQDNNGDSKEEEEDDDMKKVEIGKEEGKISEEKEVVNDDDDDNDEDELNRKIEEFIKKMKGQLRNESWRAD
ncbi:hypothetical protein BVRB_3g055620 [Beta vulgaris subsp. vulgaris]|uniref:Uncharacterized protein n=1 Tax=Beta vulgaris subsp. vulgaris TaxID=3555 RepID=A0A0J8CUZ9_BETVV|nr:hypothetical protein BVRB_3g055620 [Beta vulgaris subsp. vulgaris]